MPLTGAQSNFLDEMSPRAAPATRRTERTRAMRLTIGHLRYGKLARCVPEPGNGNRETGNEPELEALVYRFPFPVFRIVFSDLRGRKSGRGIERGWPRP